MTEEKRTEISMDNLRTLWVNYKIDGAVLLDCIARARKERDETRTELERVYRVLGNYGGKLDAPPSKIAQTIIDLVLEERADEERVASSAEARGFEKGVRETIARVRTLDAHARSADVVTELLPAASDKTKEGA